LLLSGPGRAAVDFIDSDAGFDRQHYAFLVTETEFDEIFVRVRVRDLPSWSDPMHHDSQPAHPQNIH
jgi:hypothetical protein